MYDKIKEAIKKDPEFYAMAGILLIGLGVCLKINSNQAKNLTNAGGLIANQAETIRKTQDILNVVATEGHAVIRNAETGAAFRFTAERILNV